MKPPQILFNQQDSVPVVMIYRWKVLYLLAIELYNFVGCRVIHSQRDSFWMST